MPFQVMNTSPHLFPLPDGEEKKKKSLKHFIKKTIARKFNATSTDGLSTDGDETVITADDPNSVEIPLEMADEAVSLAEERVNEVLAQSFFIKRCNRLYDVPSFTQDDFELGKRLGHGGFANVYKLEQWYCDCELNEEENWGKQYVIKSLRINQATNPQRLAMAAADMVLEAYYITAMDHPNIISLSGMSNKGLYSLKRGRVDGLFLMLEYLPQTLYRRIHRWKKEPKASLNDRLGAAVQLASALEYIHKKNIIYRDLKPANAGFTEDGTLKLFDFGLSVEVPPTTNPNKVFNLAGKKGTPRYMAPEIARKKAYNAKVDVFSFAILCWQILALQKPFSEHKESEAALNRILHGERPPLDLIEDLPLPPDDCEMIQQLLRKGWSKKIEERPTMAEVHEQLSRILPPVEGVILTRNSELMSVGSDSDDGSSV